MHLSIKNYLVASRQINQSVPVTTGSKQCRGKRQRGHTFPELMATCTIIGVMVAFAIPSPLRYICKAKLAEAFRLFPGIKLELTIFHKDEGRFPDENEFDNLPLVTGNYVSETVYYADPVNPTIEFVMKSSRCFPDGQNTIAWKWNTEWNGGTMKGWWSCKPSENNGRTTIQYKCLPTHCRD